MSQETRWVRAQNRVKGPTHAGAAIHVTTKGRRKTVCEDFDRATALEQLREDVEHRYKQAEAGEPTLRERLHLTRALKRVLRCGADFEKAKQQLETDLAEHPDDLQKIIAEAQTPLGGYIVATPPWSPHITHAYRKMGVSATIALHFEDIGPTPPYSGSIHRTKQRSLAKRTRGQFELADIVSVSGHHYNSHLAPGLFTDIKTNRGFDVRYNLETTPAGFPNLELFAASGCATLCHGAQEVLAAMFPKAIFLGAKNTMPFDAGKTLWPTFSGRLADNATPLLLDNDQDFELITHEWRIAMIAAMESEAERLLNKKGTKLSASRIAGKQQQLIEETGLGFVRENLAHYLTAPEPGTIEVVDVSAKTNGCQRKADDRNIYPAP